MGNCASEANKEKLEEAKQKFGTSMRTFSQSVKSAVFKSAIIDGYAVDPPEVVDSACCSWIQGLQTSLSDQYIVLDASLMNEVVAVTSHEAYTKAMRTLYYEHRLVPGADQVTRISAAARFINQALEGNIEAVTLLAACYRFIAEHISLDAAQIQESEEPLDQSPEAVLKRGSANSKGYADLFVALAAAVVPDVKCLAICGSARGAHSLVAQGALDGWGGDVPRQQDWWVAVNINNDALNPWRIIHMSAAAENVTVTEPPGASTYHVMDASPSASPRPTVRIMRGFSPYSCNFLVKPAIAANYLRPLADAVPYANAVPSAADFAAAPVVFPRFYAHGLEFATASGAAPAGVIMCQDGCLEFNYVAANNAEVQVSYEVVFQGATVRWEATDTRDPLERTIARSASPQLFHLLPHKYWFKTLEYKELSVHDTPGTVATPQEGDQALAQVSSTNPGALYATGDQPAEDMPGAPGAMPDTGAGAGAGAAPASAAAGAPGVAGTGGKPARRQRWTHVLHARFPQAGSYQIRVLTNVASQAEMPHLAAVFGVVVANTAEVTLEAIGLQPKPCRELTDFIFPRPLSGARLVWLVDPVEGALQSYDFQFTLRIPDEVTKLSLGFPRQKDPETGTIQTLTIWRRSEGPTFLGDTPGGTQLLVGASLKSHPEGQEVLLLAQPGEQASLMAAWEFFMRPAGVLAAGPADGADAAAATGAGAVQAFGSRKAPPPMTVMLDAGEAAGSAAAGAADAGSTAIAGMGAGAADAAGEAGNAAADAGADAQVEFEKAVAKQLSKAKQQAESTGDAARDAVADAALNATGGSRRSSHSSAAHPNVIESQAAVAEAAAAVAALDALPRSRASTPS